MKIFKVIMITVMMAAVLFLLQGVGAVDHDPVEQSNVHDDEFYNTLTDSIKTYNDILNGLNSEAYTISSTDGENYDDYYGGAYVDEETGELIVLVTELTPEATSKISTYAGGSENIRYQLCDVSYSQIEEAIETIIEHMSELYDRGVEVVLVRDDILNGRVVVGVIDLDHEKETMIRTIANYDFLVFEDSERSTPEAAYGAGSQIESIKEEDVPGSKNGTSTFGFAARLNGQEGFVMAAHAGWAIGQKIKSGNTLLGTISKTAVTHSYPTADASFVKAANGITVTNKVDGASISNAVTYDLPVNTPICMRGSQSSWTYGKVVGVNGNIDYVRSDNIRVFVLKCTYGDYKSTSGDSGAPILYFGGAQSGEAWYSLAGIHVGISNGYRYYSPYKNIVDELGVSFVAK